MFCDSLNTEIFLDNGTIGLFIIQNATDQKGKENGKD